MEELEYTNSEAYLMSLTPFERSCYIQRCAVALAQKAERLGVSMRIERKPLQPLAMGNAGHAIDTWPARHQPAAQPKGGTP